MKSKQKKIRLAVSGLLLAAVVGTGIYAYRLDQSSQAQMEKMAQIPDETEEKTENVSTSRAEADMPEETESQPAPTAEPVPETTPVPETEETVTAAETPLEFSESSVLVYPMEGTTGEILIPFNMENTVYFPTLDVYKCSPAMVMAAETGTPVMAAAASQVLLVENNEETGLTVTMDMGNGYQAVYGQLAEVTVEPGQRAEASAVIGTVGSPTKYYVDEGSNLYFAMTKDGDPIDPSLYLPPAAE